MTRSQESEPRTRHHSRRETNPFDLAMGLKLGAEPMPARTSDKGRSFEMLVAPFGPRKITGRAELKAA